jgi:hypothetical protein
LRYLDCYNYSQRDTDNGGAVTGERREVELGSVDEVIDARGALIKDASARALDNPNQFTVSTLLA